LLVSWSEVVCGYYYLVNGNQHYHRGRIMTNGAIALLHLIQIRSPKSILSPTEFSKGVLLRRKVRRNLCNKWKSQQFSQKCLICFLVKFYKRFSVEVIGGSWSLDMLFPFISGNILLLLVKPLIVFICKCF